MGLGKISGLISKFAIPAVAVIGLSGYTNKATSSQQVYVQPSQLEQSKPEYNFTISPANYLLKGIGPDFQTEHPKPQPQLEDRLVNPKFVLRENDPRFECLERRTRNFILSSANYSEKGDVVPNFQDMRAQYSPSEKIVIFAYFPENFSGSSVIMTISGQKDPLTHKDIIIEKYHQTLGFTPRERVVLRSIQLEKPGLYTADWAVSQEEEIGTGLDSKIIETGFKVACVQFFNIRDNK